MKNPTSKKLFACIISIIIFSASLNAQPESLNAKEPSQLKMEKPRQEQKSSQEGQAALINCHCTPWHSFSGCGANDACKRYCLAYCRYHMRINNDVENSTSIEFFVEETGKVSINVYDLSGRLVTTLTDHTYTEGEHSLSLNSADEKSNAIIPGIYSLKMISEESSETGKLIVMK